MNDTFSKIIDTIITRTGGYWDKMTLSDKILLKSYYTELYEQLEKAKPVIDFWVNLDIHNEIEKEESPEMVKLEWEEEIRKRIKSK